MVVVVTGWGGDERERQLGPRPPGEAASLRAEGDGVGVGGVGDVVLPDSALVLIQALNKHDARRRKCVSSVITAVLDNTCEPDAS